MDNVAFKEGAESDFRGSWALMVGSKTPGQKASEFFVYSRNIIARFWMSKIEFTKDLLAYFDLPIGFWPLPSVQKIKNVGKTPDIWLVP